MKFVVTPQKIENLAKMKEAGADVLLLGSSFYATRSACEIPEEDLVLWKKACDQYQLELFVLVNRLFCEEELDRLTTYLTSLKKLHVDGVVFGDEGVLQLAKQLELTSKLIYQPDTLVTNHLDVNFYLDQGLHSVVLAKEITLEEIIEIAKYSDAKRLEVIIHGRLPMMHSKRTLLSNYFAFMKKDYNPVYRRDLFVKEETREVHMPIYEDAQGTHVFSGFTQHAFMEIQKIQESGIGYVRIDGIFHEDAYSIEVLQLYKKVLKGEMAAQDAYALLIEKYPEDALESGFFYTKTSKTK